MRVFQSLLILFLLGIIGYTLTAGSNHGWDLGSVFFGELTSFSWSGQFNYDFLCYLTLSAIWVAWRARFSAGSILLAACAQILGILFFAPYLLYLTIQTKGDMKALLLGKRV